MKMTISVGRCLKRNTMLVWVKEYMIENFATCKNLCNLQELYTDFKEKHPNVNIGSSKFCALRPKWRALTGSKMAHSVYVCRLIETLCCWSTQWTGTWHTRTWTRRSFTILRATNASCIGVIPVLALQLWNNVLIRNSKNMKMMRNLITVSGTLRIEQYWQPLQTLTRNTKRLWVTLLII